MTIVLRGNFREKIKSEFPDLTEEQLNGLSINWRVLKVLGDEKSKLSIVIRMQHGGSLTAEMAQAVTEYGKTLVENTVKDHFKMQPGKSSQQV
jgi:hypothetical protein